MLNILAMMLRIGSQSDLRLNRPRRRHTLAPSRIDQSVAGRAVHQIFSSTLRPVPADTRMGARRFCRHKEFHDSG